MDRIFVESMLGERREYDANARIVVAGESGDRISLRLLPDGTLEINGSRSLVLRMSSGNVVTVRPARFDE
jgi:hypothetical protein